MSFLGAFNNREQNLKKLAKANTVRLNCELAGKKEVEAKKLNVQSMNQSQNHNQSGVNSVKRNINSRKATKVTKNYQVVAGKESGKDGRNRRD